MAGQELEQAVASTSELPAEEAISRLRDVVLGAHPNDAESIKAKEQARTWCLHFASSTHPIKDSLEHNCR